jgi:hypothetical protein
MVLIEKTPFLIKFFYSDGTSIVSFAQYHASLKNKYALLNEKYESSGFYVDKIHCKILNKNNYKNVSFED